MRKKYVKNLNFANGKFAFFSDCLTAQDPYCGWNSQAGRCVSKFINGDAKQDLKGCPDPSRPIDGGFSFWTKWSNCPQMSQNGENCQCRERTCTRPIPANGGKDCQGPKIQVTNCTQHGGWTSWSHWSACDATCGIAIRTRRRDCSNPSPAFGGRLCLGPDLLQEYCPKIECPASKELPVNGGWTNWSEFTACSAECGGGIRKRNRNCANPAPANGGLECPGPDADIQICNAQNCEEKKRWSKWTPWVRVDDETHANNVLLRRYRFGCTAPVSDPDLIHLSNPREQQKICPKGEKCNEEGKKFF